MNTTEIQNKSSAWLKKQLISPTALKPFEITNQKPIEASRYRQLLTIKEMEDKISKLELLNVISDQQELIDQISDTLFSVASRCNAIREQVALLSESMCGDLPDFAKTQAA